MMKTEKRKANVGERILITKATEAQGYYENGDVSKVVETGVFGESGTVHVREHVRPIYESEYEVIIESPKKSARITALESQVATLQAKVEALESAGKYPLTAKFERESAEADAILADIERKAKPTLEALLATYPTPNEQRADVIKRAKAFVDAQFIREGVVRSRHSGPNNVEFVVNSEKRTVVALLRRTHVFTDQLRHKGIAKCDPDDVFNADIGKAIALARALGVEVPVEFVKAVQPTEVVVGHFVKDGYGPLANGKVTHITTSMARASGGYRVEDGGWSFNEDAIITDDTDAVYE